jgi:hypothetical protein
LKARLKISNLGLVLPEDPTEPFPNSRLDRTLLLWAVLFFILLVSTLLLILLCLLVRDGSFLLEFVTYESPTRGA